MGFAEDFQKASDKTVREHVNGTMRAAAKDFGRVLVDRTPESDGDAKGNWRAAKRSSRRFVEGADASSEQPSNEAAIDGTDFYKGESVTWSNGAPYIWKLERGSSDQAPAGMLAVTTGDWPTILQRAEAGSKAGGE